MLSADAKRSQGAVRIAACTVLFIALYYLGFKPQGGASTASDSRTVTRKLVDVTAANTPNVTGTSPSPNGTIGAAPPGNRTYRCRVDPNNDYQGTTLKWGADNLKPNWGACCDDCAAFPGCNVWVYCSVKAGCGEGRAYQECWLKQASLEYIISNYKQGNPSIPWTGGSIYSDADAIALRTAQRQARIATVMRLRQLRNNRTYPLIYFNVTINGTDVGSLEIVPNVIASPRQAENLRVIASGEKQGLSPSGKPYTFKNATFYRIVVNFIDQTGPGVESIYGGTFLDDIGGLQLQHNRSGILSSANLGPNTNNGDFSIMMSPQPHLNGAYVIFGEVVNPEGALVLDKINQLAVGQPGNELRFSPLPVIANAGQARRGTYVDTPEYKAVIDSEYRRVAYNKGVDPAELQRRRDLWTNAELPLVYLEVAINGTYYGRISVVLFAKDAPLYSEAFRLLCTGEAGVDPQGNPYSYKGANFYRIIYQFIDQLGPDSGSPFGGLFRDDAGGLKLNHTRAGLLSAANTGPNTNGGHFSIVMGAFPHLNGLYTIFGEVVDGLHVAEAINELAEYQPQQTLMNSEAAVVIDCGQLRLGTYAESAEYQAIIAAEKARIANATQST